MFVCVRAWHHRLLLATLANPKRVTEHRQAQTRMTVALSWVFAVLELSVQVLLTKWCVCVQVAATDRRLAILK